MWSNVLLGASSLDGTVGGLYERGVEETGVRSQIVDTSQRLLKRKVSHRWTARHAAQARSVVISGAVDAKTGCATCIGRTAKICKCCEAGRCGNNSDCLICIECQMP